MAKIDRLGWADGLSVYCHGLRIGIRVNKPEVLDKVTEHLPPGWEHCCTHYADYLYSLRVGGARGRVRDYTMLYGGLKKLARTMDLNEALEALESDLQMYVAEWAKNRVFVHAGVVGWNGRAIVIPGRTMSGKSSLTAALLRAGATYYSDEYAVFDGRGYVEPYARRLSLRQEGKPPRRCSADEFGCETGVEPLPVGLVAITKYQPFAHWQPRPLTQGKAVLEIANHALATQREPDTVLHTLEKAVQGATLLKGLRGEADETAEELLRLVDQTTSGCVAWTALQRAA